MQWKKNALSVYQQNPKVVHQYFDMSFNFQALTIDVSLDVVPSSQALEPTHMTKKKPIQCR